MDYLSLDLNLFIQHNQGVRMPLYLCIYALWNTETYHNKNGIFVVDLCFDKKVL